jgi:hypothetical protein
LASRFGTATHDITACGRNSTMVKLCAAPSQGIVTRPGTRNVAFTFPVDVTAASSCFISTTSGLRLLLCRDLELELELDLDLRPFGGLYHERRVGATCAAGAVGANGKGR